MAVMTVLQAVNDALHHAMGADRDVVVLGEDIAELGGVFRATDGLLAKHGPERVMNTPLAESGIIGTAIGMALYGLKPVPEIQFLDFIYPAFDQIVSEAAKMRYRSGGQFTCPMVIRTPYGGGIRGGHYHSQSSETYFIHTPGLKVVVPSNPADTKGLLLEAIADPDPVVFLEPKAIYRTVKGEVPEGDHRVPFGKAAVAREGADAVVLCWGAMVHTALKAAALAEEQGWQVEVLDLRSLVPLDEEAVVEAAKRSGRVVILHEAPRTNGFGGELAALVAERAFEWLRAPVLRVTGFDTPFPYTLEHIYMPDAKRTFKAIERVMTF
ncbi:MAG: alpha-ketoacid dehydrogenase subunit beta [Planctomycetaceae bacterium]|nr:alpha-ketoacid dehydrogenase subunit beta [Planctomycetota bacterium]NUN52298.1 alpha-ketoacid dehydrogenase subunit beta [Planctomycetaceae bacterium]